MTHTVEEQDDDLDHNIIRWIYYTDLWRKNSVIIFPGISGNRSRVQGAHFDPGLFSHTVMCAGLE